MEAENRWSLGAVVGLLFLLPIYGAFLGVIGMGIGGVVAEERGAWIGAAIGVMVAIPLAVSHARTRDKTLERFSAHLQSLGIDVQTAPRGRAEEKIYTGPRSSLGIIDIADGPIRWVNVTVATSARGSDEDLDMPYYLVYGVPDARVGPGFPAVWLFQDISVLLPLQSGLIGEILLQSVEVPQEEQP